MSKPALALLLVAIGLAWVLIVQMRNWARQSGDRENLVRHPSEAQNAVASTSESAPEIGQAISSDNPATSQDSKNQPPGFLVSDDARNPVIPRRLPTQKRETDLTPVRQPRHRDIGVDLALPTYSRVKLKDQPDENATTIRNVAPDETLVLVNRVPSSGWLDVIDVRSGKEGWVNQNEVQISLTQRPEPAPKFAEEYRGPDTLPEVSVENATGENLSLKIEGSLYSIEPDATLSIPLTGGTYSYYATEPGVIPAMGKQEFRRGYRYTWKFWIETSYAPVH